MSKHYSSFDAGVEWDTPDYVWEPIADAVGGFDLGPASGAEGEQQKADTLYTKEDDGLAQEWFGDVWINPPYGRQFNSEWGQKVWNEHKSCNTDSITALVPASTSTNWWQNNYANADLFCFIDHRLKFNDENMSASFANVICYFGEPNDEIVDVFDELGFVAESVL